MYNSLHNKDAIKEIIVKYTNKVDALYNGEKRPDIHKNVIDPFSSIFDGGFLGLPQEDWITKEISRQTQKTLQNMIGDFHQEILGTFDGWRDLGVAGGMDLINDDLKIFAEIKNKFNTTKGNHKPTIYDDILNFINNEHLEYTGYLVEIIPARPKQYNKLFTPPKDGVRRPDNDAIKVIDGVSFYNLVSGEENTLRDLFKFTFDVIKKAKNTNISISDYEFFFNKAYDDK